MADAKKVEAKKEEVKAAAPAAKAPAKKAAAKKPAAKKAAPAKKAADQIEAKVVIELPNVSESTDSLIDRAKADWTAKGNALNDMKQLTLYINAVEGMVYYVVNKNDEGKIELF